MTQNLKHLRHPRPADPFRDKAIRDRAQRQRPTTRVPWKDSVPFSGTRRDGQPVGLAVQVPHATKRSIQDRVRRHLDAMAREAGELGLDTEVAA